MVKAKRVGILQPVYLPWIGYFEQMAYVDEFIIMDDVQYTKHNWRNRNKIRTKTGSIWITVPVKKHVFKEKIGNIEINYEQNWVKKHLRSIKLNYQSCRYFNPLFDEISNILNSRFQTLLDLDSALIVALMKYLNINVKIDYSSKVPKVNYDDLDRNLFLNDSKYMGLNRRVAEICAYHGGNIFYEGASGAKYINVNFFKRKGIEVVFQNYHHPIYKQKFGKFEPYMSVIDLIMNEGPNAPDILRSSPVPQKLIF